MTDPLFLLDSNICIYLLRGASPTARAYVQAYEPGELVTSAVAFAEVIIGARSREAVAQAEAFFAVVTVLPFDEAAARTYATMPFRRARYDRLIAAHALSLGLTLVTNNERDFADIPDLRIENWTV
ncbi:MAG: type II toxin-antitoxin system VapC family toxin [Sphingomonadales bacterium]|nr:MAG: type II toxin-antitoxin system VapC family toxin [Sphingomonadales bacterium]